MRISNALDLGLYVRDRRRELGLSQAALAGEALVSRRWLSDLEAGKATAELGLAIRVLQALGLELTASPVDRTAHIDLDTIRRARHWGHGPDGQDDDA